MLTLCKNIYSDQSMD